MWQAALLMARYTAYPELTFSFAAPSRLLSEWMVNEWAAGPSPLDADIVRSWQGTTLSESPFRGSALYTWWRVWSTVLQAATSSAAAVLGLHIAPLIRCPPTSQRRTEPWRVPGPPLTTATVQPDSLVPSTTERGRVYYCVSREFVNRSLSCSDPHHSQMVDVTTTQMDNVADTLLGDATDTQRSDMDATQLSDMVVLGVGRRDAHVKHALPGYLA